MTQDWRVQAYALSQLQQIEQTASSLDSVMTTTDNDDEDDDDDDVSMNSD